MINGILEYTEAKASIFFEKGHVACNYCPILETYSRNQCRLTGEYILDPKYLTGHYCPLTFKEEEHKND